MGVFSKQVLFLLVILAISVQLCSGWRRRRRRGWCCPGGCGHGSCVGNYHCSCHSGWYGGNCQYARCPHGCNNGHCYYPNRCRCRSGWTRYDCGSPICPYGCQHGTCSSPNFCRCHYGYKGYTCNVPICNQGCVHGTCTRPNNCHCSRGMTGPSCNIPICPGECRNGGTCIAPDTCSCQAEYTGQNCEIRLCPKIQIPRNGLANCKVDYERSEQTCQLQCNPGYEFSTNRAPDKLQVCDKDGMWTHEAANIEIPDCTPDRPVDLALDFTMEYSYAGSCDNVIEEDMDEIRLYGLDAFVYRLCLHKCEDLYAVVKNLTCGVKTDTTGSQDDTGTPADYDGVYDYGYHYQQTDPTPAPSEKTAFTLTVEVFTPTNVSGSLPGEEELILFESRLDTAITDTEDKVKEQPVLIPLTRLETILEIGLESLERSTIDLVCSKHGEMIVNNTCHSCSRGSYYNNDTSICLPCPLRTYQDTEGQDHCNSCLDGLQTRLIGSKREEDCQPLCPPGSFSANGKQPCTPCPSHRTQPRVGQTNCV